MADRLMNRRDGLRTLATAGVVAAVATSATPTPVLAEDVDPDKLPAAIKKVAERFYKKRVKWTSVTKTKEDGEDVYELFGELHEEELPKKEFPKKEAPKKEAPKRWTLSMEITDGKLTSIEVEVAVSDVPKVVMDKLEDKTPKFAPEHALVIYEGEDITDLGKADTSYQLNGPAAKGNDLTVLVTAAGKFIETKRQVDATELPKEVSDAVAKKFPKFKLETAYSVKRDREIAEYILTGAGGRVVTASPDGKELEIHRDG